MNPIHITNEGITVAMSTAANAYANLPTQVRASSAQIVNPARPGHMVPAIVTAWEFTAEERDAIAAGANLVCVIVSEVADYRETSFAIEGVELAGGRR